MPNWVNASKNGLFICLVCSGVAMQTLAGWTCTNHSCHKHDDEPVRQKTNIPYFDDPRAGLASGTAIGTSDLK